MKNGPTKCSRKMAMTFCQASVKRGVSTSEVPVRYRLNPAHARQPFLKAPQQRPVVENLVPRNQGQRCQAHDHSGDGKAHGAEVMARPEAAPRRP